MTLKSWITSLTTITSLVIVCALVFGGIAYAQQPQAQTPAQPTQRGTGVSMTNPTSSDGKPITKFDQPAVDRWMGTSMTNPTTPDGKPLTTSTSFGQR
ncbi:MAG TPA: hypothetical protein VJX92_29455 [Methylomirabilota bacterium]|nr:hypothetical protein [Methylomirabilota bacterium]